MRRNTFKATDAETEVSGLAALSSGRERRDLQQRARRVFREQLAVPDVPSQHCVGGMAGLLPDLPRRCPGLSCAGGKACTQAVPRIAGRIEASRGRPLPDHDRDCVAGEPIRQHMPVAVHGPEDWTSINPR